MATRSHARLGASSPQPACADIGGRSHISKNVGAPLPVRSEAREEGQYADEESTRQRGEGDPTAPPREAIFTLRLFISDSEETQASSDCPEQEIPAAHPSERASGLKVRTHIWNDDGQSSNERSEDEPSRALEEFAQGEFPAASRFTCCDRWWRVLVLSILGLRVFRSGAA